MRFDPAAKKPIQLNDKLFYHKGVYFHWCPGCEVLHGFYVDRAFEGHTRWLYNGHDDRPSFAPSMDVGRDTALRCHYFLKDGQLRFLPDSHHALAGQTVALPDIPKDEYPIL